MKTKQELKLELLEIGGVDDGSLAYLFRNYKDDGKREPLIDFGERVGNEIFD